MNLSQRLFWLLVIAYLLVFAVLIALHGYGYAWTGFGPYTEPDGEYLREKTLWDWLDLLVIPIALLVGGYFLNRSERNREREIAEKSRQLDRQIAEDRAQEQALQAYLDQMSSLLIDKQLKDPDSEHNQETRDIARVWTLTILRRISPERKATVLNFLYEAELIGIHEDLGGGIIAQHTPIIELRGADLQQASLSNAVLSNAVLSEANLGRADLSMANLRGANLSGAFLSETDLSGADLSGASLIWANLREANLSGTNLSMADLRGVDLRGVDLQKARYTNSTWWPTDFDPKAAGATEVQ